MKQVKFFRLKGRMALSMAVLFSVVSFAASPPTRLDLFDAADNHLMFVTFEYNGQKNISRTIYMSDSTFVRRVLIDTAAQSASTEYSINFNGDTIITTNTKMGSANSSFSIMDQFHVDQIGDTVNCSPKDGDPLSYSLSYKSINASAANMTYEQNAQGALTRVTIFDNNGTRAYYGIFSNGATAIVHSAVSAQQAIAHVRSVNARTINVDFFLTKPSLVKCELITPIGKRSEVLFNEPLSVGRHGKLIRIGSEASRRLANGVYLLVVSVDGTAISKSKYIFQHNWTW
jgi:hypothetical protein